MIFTDHGNFTGKVAIFGHNFKYLTVYVASKSDGILFFIPPVGNAVVISMRTFTFVVKINVCRMHGNIH